MILFKPVQLVDSIPPRVSSIVKSDQDENGYAVKPDVPRAIIAAYLKNFYRESIDKKEKAHG